MYKTKLNKQLASVALKAIMGTGLLCASTLTLADNDTRFYVGAEYGQSRVNESDFDDDDSALKLFIGGKFNKYIGVEGAINDYGETESTGYSSELKGNTAAIVVFLPIMNNFDLFAKGGRLWWRNDVSVLDTFDEELDGTENFFGLGASFHFNKNVSLRAEMERYEVDFSEDEIGVDVDAEADVDVASIGIAFQF